MLRLRAVVSLVAVCACATGLAQGFPYVIDSFDTDVRLNKDATIDVTERITVTFNESRRGIFRKIPIVYDAGGGRKRAVQLKLQTVADGSGNRLTTDVAREGDYLRVRIGDEDVWLDTGTQFVYVIQYRVFGALNWQENANWEPWTELYWNVTGDEWDTQISTATFHVTFPKSGGEANVRGRAFAGPYGSSNSAYLDALGETGSDNPALTSLSLSDGDFYGTRLAALAPFEGLTLVLGVPASSVPRPPWWVELMRRASEYLALLTPVVVLLAMWAIWSKHGRDQKDGPTTVRFEPPSSLPATEAGTMLDERVDQRDLAAGIMSLCVKGYYTVEVVKAEGVFASTEYQLLPTEKTDEAGLSLFEAALLKRLQAAGDRVTKTDLRTYVAPYIQGLKGAIYEDFATRGLYRSNPASVRGLAIVAGIFMCAFVAFVLHSLSLAGEVWVAVLGTAIAIVPAASFGWHMPQRTRYGDQVRRETRGFYEMMRHRKNYMAWVVEKQPDGLKYEEYLPYAVAFDCIEEWSDAFKDIVHEPPRWYHDPYGGVFYPMMFANNLRSMTSELGSSAATPPRSSGASGGSSGFSSGGGFSGGGFGGGGGGSW